MQKSIQIKNQNICFYESKNDGVPVFLIHGNSLSSEVFKNQLDSPLLKDYRLIAPDLPGHGNSFRSSAPDVDYRLPNLVEILIEFINSFGFKEYFLYGNSLGGHLLINCLPYLKRVKGLALSGTPPLSSPPDMATCYLPNPATPLAFKPVLSKVEINLLVSAFCKPSSEHISEISEIIQKSDPEFRNVVGAGLMSERNSDEIKLLNQANIPVAIIHGIEDSCVNLEYLKQIKVKKWDGKVHTIDNAGHLSFLENPERFNGVLGRFLNDLNKN